MRAATSGVASAWCVRSSPTMTTSHPALKTMSAASGSMTMLNSATGLQLPTCRPPPIRTTSLTRSTMRGSLRAARAMFVRPAVGTSVTVPGSCAMTVSMMRSTACRSSRSNDGSGSIGPSRPLSPWMSSATSISRRSGRGEPAANGMPVMPAMRATARALRVTFGRVWLPTTVVTASRSMSGFPWASSIATASSWPGSQSRMILLGTRAGTRSSATGSPLRRGWNVEA